jgi:8-oxo-dGTP pyrophosphatase MutT (NUDIX family)
MKFIKTIGYDAGLPYEIRERVEGIVYNDEGKIALIKAGKYHYHVFPGGGIESNETPYEALIREVREETGVQIKNIVELGMIIEHEIGKYRCQKVKDTRRDRSFQSQNAANFFTK